MVKAMLLFMKLNQFQILKKRTCVGISFLDLSKWKTYDFHYKLIEKSFQAKLLFTDTDGVTYEIKSERVYEKIFK